MRAEQVKSHPRTKPPEERQDDLMNAAQALFLEKGIGPTTIEQITARAGVAKGSFYLQFSSKEEIHAALGERFVGRYVADLDMAIARLRPEDWSGKIATWAKIGLVSFIEDAPLVNMLFHAHPSAPEGSSNLIVDSLRKLLEDGSAAGAWSIEDAAQTATFLFGGLHSIADEVLAGTKRVNRAKLIRSLQDLFFKVVGVERPQAFDRIDQKRAQS